MLKLQAVSLPNTMQELFEVAQEKLDVCACRVFNNLGCEIDEIELIRDDDVLYMSEGEDYRSPTTSNANSGDEWVTLNVGGRRFTTTRSSFCLFVCRLRTNCVATSRVPGTLLTKEPESMLGRMFAHDSLVPSPRDATGAFLIDRSPEYFEPIIGWLRHGDLILNEGVNPRGVLEECRFYGIESLVRILEQIVEKDSSTELELALRPLTRRDVINALIGTPCTSELRFQGINLCGADLSKVFERLPNDCSTNYVMTAAGPALHQLQVRADARMQLCRGQLVVFGYGARGHERMLSRWRHSVR